MSTSDHAVSTSIAVEHTTEFALTEKAKLKKSLRRIDMMLFTLCALVGLDTLGAVASYGPQGFFWLALMAITFVVPYMLIMSEVGSSFTEEGGPYEWVKLTFGARRRGSRPLSTGRRTRSGSVARSRSSQAKRGRRPTFPASTSISSGLR